MKTNRKPILVSMPTSQELQATITTEQAGHSGTAWADTPGLDNTFNFLTEI